MAKEPIIHFLKPAEGRAVLREDGSEWPKDGAEVEETRFVRRRLRDGDLVKATQQAPVETDPDAAAPDAEPATPATDEPNGETKSSRKSGRGKTKEG